MKVMRPAIAKGCTPLVYWVEVSYWLLQYYRVCCVLKANCNQKVDTNLVVKFWSQRVWRSGKYKSKWYFVSLYPRIENPPKECTAVTLFEIGNANEKIFGKCFYSLAVFVFTPSLIRPCRSAGASATL